MPILSNVIQSVVARKFYLLFSKIKHTKNSIFSYTLMHNKYKVMNKSKKINLAYQEQNEIATLLY